MTVVSYKPPIVSGQGATISADGLYRFDLWRIWDRAKRPALFVMLNPSKADGVTDDPTIRRCIRFADSWGFGGLVVVNLFAMRSTDPSVLVACGSRTAAGGGPANDVKILERADLAGAVVLAWGVGGSLYGRGQEVASMLRRYSPVCLGVTTGGQPRHPLYVRADKAREIWNYKE